MSRKSSRAPSPCWEGEQEPNPLGGEHEERTRDDPLGSIILNLAGKINTLIENNPKMNKDVINYSKLCNNFVDFSELSKKNQPRLLDITDSVQNSILDKEMNYSLLDNIIKPPAFFSKSDTLNEPRRMAEVLKCFPTKDRFSTASSVNILQHLENINYAQSIANLSESEFVNILPKCFKNEAYLHLIEWISHGMKVGDIYHSLTKIYDDRDNHETARIKLNEFRIRPNMKLIKIISQLQMLASRVASILPPGEGRTSLYNIEATSALIKVLPLNSSHLLQNHVNSLQAKMLRVPTFIEVTKSITPFFTSIEADIEANAFNTFKKKNFLGQLTEKREFRNKRVENWNHPNKVNSHSILYSQGENMKRENFKGNFSPNKNNQYEPNTFRGNWRSNYSPRDRSERTKQNFSGNFQRFNNFSANGRYNGTKYCSLCGQSNHNASDGCNQMKFNNRIVRVIPTHRPCNICEEIDGKKLYHPSRYCFRKPNSDK